MQAKRHDLFWKHVAAVFALNALVLGLMLTPALGAKAMLWTSDLFGLVAAALSCAVCLLGARQADARGRGRGLRALCGPRGVPLLLALTLFSYTCGVAIWDYDELILGRETPFPSVADVGFLMVIPFLLLATLRLPARGLPPAVRTRVLLDGLMAMTAVAVFSWFFVLGPTVLQGGETRLATAIGVAYPLGDLMLLACMLLLAPHYNEPKLRRVALTLSAGTAFYVVADVLYGYGVFHGTYASAGPIDLGWSVGNMLFGVAGYWAWRLPEAERRREGRANGPAVAQGMMDEIRDRGIPLLSALLPYALVPAVGLLLVYVLVAPVGVVSPWLKRGVYVGAGLLMTQILLRQVLVILENKRLNVLLRSAYGLLTEEHRKTREYAEAQEQMNEELQAMHSELETQNASLAAANEKLESLATTDGMTGLANHRAFQEALRREAARAEHDETPVSVLLLDVDYFKQYNDKFGHPAGDRVLVEVAALLRESVRPGDLPARYGGEEFAVILPATAASDARVVAERVRARVSAHAFPHRAITLSIGVTDAVWSGYSPERLVDGADRALYAAKHAGRNRVLTNLDDSQDDAAELRMVA